MFYSSTALGKTHKRIIAIIVFIVSLAGCTMGTSVTGDVPTNISATALSPTSIRVYWTRDPTDISTDTVIVMRGTAIAGTATAASPLDSALVTGLASGVPYTIIIATVNGRSYPVPYTLGFTYLPTNISVTAQTVNTITVSWTRNDSDITTDTILVTTTDGGIAGNSPVIVPGGTSSGIVTGLAPGVTYVITIGSETGRGTAISYTVPGLPTSIFVNAMSPNSIGVTWARGAGDTAADTIVAMNNNTVVSTAIVKGDTGIVTGLSEMTSYDISVHVITGVSSAITWMTAERFNGIKIYEWADSTSGDPRGLQLAANATQAVVLPGASNPDFVLANDSTVTSHLVLQSGDSIDPAWKNMNVDPTYIFNDGGLNTYYRDTAYSFKVDSTHSVVIPGSKIGGSLIFDCRTANGNLALIEIVPPDSTGLLYGISNGHKFITVNVSYQAQPNAPYAGRGHARSTKPVVTPIHSVRTVTRKSAH